jgi:hypothetical protein
MSRKSVIHGHGRSLDWESLARQARRVGLADAERRGQLRQRHRRESRATQKTSERERLIPFRGELQKHSTEFISFRAHILRSIDIREKPLLDTLLDIFEYLSKDVESRQ